MDEQRAAAVALHEPRTVVQPGIVAAQVPSPDKRQMAVRATVGLGKEPGARFLHELLWRRVNLPISSGEAAGEAARLQRAEVEAVRRRAEPGERQLVRPEAQQQIEDPVRL